MSKEQRNTELDLRNYDPIVILKKGGEGSFFLKNNVGKLRKNRKWKKE